MGERRSDMEKRPEWSFRREQVLMSRANPVSEVCDDEVGIKAHNDVQHSANADTTSSKTVKEQAATAVCQGWGRKSRPRRNGLNDLLNRFRV